MPFGINTNDRANVPFKNLMGRSQTRADHDLGNEPYGIFLPSSQDYIWTSQISTNRYNSMVNGVAIEVDGDLVLHPNSSGHGYSTVWPSTVPSGTDLKTGLPYAYNVGSLSGITAGSRVLNSIPNTYNANGGQISDFASGYTNRLYSDTGMTSEIDLLDPRDWIYQCQSGIYYEETVSSPVPKKIKTWVYIGDTLSTSLIKPGSFEFVPETGKVQYETSNGTYYFYLFGDSDSGLTNVQNGDVLLYNDGIWFNSAITFSGGTGTNGTSGSSGIDGTSGSSGSDGTSGSSGIDGTSGSSGLLLLTGDTNNGIITLNGTAPNAIVNSGLTFDGNVLSLTTSNVVSEQIFQNSFTVSGLNFATNTLFNLPINKDGTAIVNYRLISQNPPFYGKGGEILFVWDIASSGIGYNDLSVDFNRACPIGYIINFDGDNILWQFDYFDIDQDVTYVEYFTVIMNIKMIC